MRVRRGHSSVSDDLPKEVREQVDRLLIEPKITYEDIQKFLKNQGHEISKSAIGRYGKKFLAVYQQLRVIEDKSKALVSQAGDGMVLEEAASKLFAQMILEAQMSGKIDITKLPRIVSDFAKLQQSVVLRERLKKDFADKIKRTISDVEKASGSMDKEELLQFIKERMYGL